MKYYLYSNVVISLVSFPILYYNLTPYLSFTNATSQTVRTGKKKCVFKKNVSTLHILYFLFYSK